MRTPALARMYDRLSVWERIPLLIAAQARKDDAEYRRLFRASQVREWRFSEHLLDEMALHTLALIYITEQLDAAGVYFFALMQEEDEELWLLSAQVSAYFFAVNAEAWERFCAELKVDPRAVIAGNYRGWFLGVCEERMPQNAPTAETVEALLRAQGRDDDLVTPDSLLANWRSTLRAMSHRVPEGR